jgi:hypothetical protein
MISSRAVLAPRLLLLLLGLLRALFFVRLVGFAGI